MKPSLQARTVLTTVCAALFFLFSPLISFAQPANDLCSNATLLVSGITCTNTAGTLQNATVSSPAVATTCTVAGGDVWYVFEAQTAYPVITLSAMGTNMDNNPRMQLFSGSCGALTNLGCVQGTAVATLAMNTAVVPGGLGLTPGDTYYIRVYSSTLAPTGANWTFSICITDAVNDVCAAAPLLPSSTTCNKSFGTLNNATYIAMPGLTSSCGTLNSQDVWYRFEAKTAYPTITVSDLGSNWGTRLRISLFQGTCLGLTEIACASNAPLVTSTTPGGAGLNVGQIYYIRIHKNNNTAPGATNWNFSICITDPGASRIEVSRSYINVTRGATGGTVNPGDTLEMRATMVIFGNSTANSADSLSFIDTVFRNGGLQLIPGTIALRTNEGMVYRTDVATKVPFTDDSLDSDAGYWRRPTGTDTIVRINFGAAANRVRRGQLSNTSRPSLWSSTCIIMATYRVRVYAPFNSKVCFKTGALTYRDRGTGVYNHATFKRDSLIVYQSPGLCPNAVSATNAIGIESNGTFGAPSTAPPLARNRSSVNVPGYVYAPFGRADQNTGPGDYYYSIANNTFAHTYTTLNTWPKVESSSPYHRLYGHWDISGDHTGAADPTRGNRACDTTLPVSPTNPCGYMLVINSAYKTDTAFQYTVTGLCPNTYYEIGAWFKNMCAKCGADSMARGYNSAGYIPSAPNDTSGVKPNIAFDVNGIDYYTTGSINYFGTASAGRDSNNRWVKRGFTYLTGPSQTSFQLTLRNNAPGGGGNDWAVDDIAVTTCLPNMQYSPSLNPNVCRLNPLTINDTIRSYFNNYVYYKWQRSTDGGGTWSDATGPLGPADTAWTGSTWEYIVSYTIPHTETDTSDNGDLYRVVVATTLANLSNLNCQFTDGISIISLAVTNCGVPLKTDLLSFNAKLVVDRGHLNWTTSKEDGPVRFDIERSTDGSNFIKIGTVNGHNDQTATVNSYSFMDPTVVVGKVYYRINMVGESGVKKYSRTIQLTKQGNETFGLVSVINPFNYTLDFDISSPGDSKIEVQLVDLMGKVVVKNTFTIHAGINALSIPNTEALPAGTYIFRVKSNETLINKKVMKKNF